MMKILEKADVDGTDIGLCVFVSRKKDGVRFCKSQKTRGKTFLNNTSGRRWHVVRLRCDGLNAPADCPYKGARK